MATATLEKKIDELQKQGATLQEALKHLGHPNAHLSNDGSAYSYWEAEETVVARPSGPGGQLKSLPKKLPREYKRGPWKSLGEMIRDGYRAKEKDNFGEFQKKHETHFEQPVLKSISGMSTQVGADGGLLILPEFNTTIMERVYTNDLWNRTDQYTLAGNNMTFLASAETSRANGSRHGGLQAFWTQEAGTIQSSKPALRQFSLKLKKIAVVVYLTDELIEDAGPVLEQYVARCVGDEFNFMLGDAIFNGSGVGQPLGIMNAPSLLAITKESNQSAGTIVAENIDKMWARRFVGGNYAWYHNQDCGPQLDSLSQSIGTAGVALYRPADGIAGVAPQLLKTAPRVETEFNATVGTAGDIVLADLGQYITISKGGIAQAVSVHVEFLTDQTALRFTMRVDGQPWEHSALTPYKGSNTQSSFIALETRAE